MNGLGRGMVVPSAVTWRSSIASSRADCDRADARFNSSAIKTLVKMGPGRKTGSRSVPVKDHRPGHVGGQEVGRELHPVEVETQRTGEGLGQRGLPQAREVLHQQVSLGEQTPDRELHRVVVGVQDALN